MAKRMGRMMGWIADYCLVCRDIQAMELRHTAQPPCTWEECSVCRHREQADPATFLAIVPEKPERVDDLMQRTYPRLPLRIASRIMWERDAIGGTLPAPERAEAIREPALILAYRLNKQRADTEISWQAVVAFIATTAAILFAMSAFGLVLDGDRLRPASALSFLGALAISTLVNVWTVRKKDTRKFQRDVEPMLARALRPLRPTVDELRAVHAWAVAAGHQMGPYLDVDRLHDCIRRIPDSSLSNADDMRIIDLARAMHQELCEASGTDDQQESIARDEA